MKQKFITGFYISVIFSLFLHLGLGFVLKFAPDKTPIKVTDQVEILFIDAKDLKNQQNQQIVEQNLKPINDETPEDAKFLGRHNQKVVKETKAAKSGDFNNKAGGKPKATSPKKPEVQGSIPSLKNLRPQFNAQFQEQSQNNNPGSVSQTSDYLKDTEVGVQTLLSTREFVFYSYYERIRNKLRQHWEPNIRQKVKRIFAQGRSIASTTDKVTKVLIVLDKRGRLMRVQVLSESGFKDIDDAAVEAFRAAQPFPNPPDGIIDADGTIKIHWDFVLEA